MGHWTEPMCREPCYSWGTLQTGTLSYLRPRLSMGESSGTSCPGEGFDQYQVMIDESRSLTSRNRRYLRLFTPFQPNMTVPWKVFPPLESQSPKGISEAYQLWYFSTSFFSIYFSSYSIFNSSIYSNFVKLWSEWNKCWKVVSHNLVQTTSYILKPPAYRGA